jgi:pyruvate/2-oxoglutarate dehydrogenase complex dihydrolipoamide dehydrogenase (E3) component
VIAAIEPYESVVGGAVIGTEFTSTFITFAVRVSMIKPSIRNMPFVDLENTRRILR